MHSADTMISLIKSFCSESCLSILPDCNAAASYCLVARRYNKVWRLGVKVLQVSLRMRTSCSLVIGLLLDPSRLSHASEGACACTPISNL